MAVRTMRRNWSWVPGTLIGSRVAMGPAIFLLSVQHMAPLLMLAALLASMLSDIFDGVIARRLKIATAPLRVADSYADAWVFAWIGLSIWVGQPGIVSAFRIPILIELGLQIGTYGFDMLRYGRVATLHAYTAKAWGFSLYLAAAGVLVWNAPWLIWLAFTLGVVSFLDALAIKLILPGWHHDIGSAFEARKMKKCQ